MKKYRLKKEAVQFFAEKHATSIYMLHTWEELGVDINALDEIEEAWIDYGGPESKISTGASSRSIAGWNKDNGGHFHFTIHFPNTEMRDHDNFSKGRVIRSLMDEIQYTVNSFYENFLVGKKD
jgi:sulfite reductase beta subunit-like hemoprotein